MVVDTMGICILLGGFALLLILRIPVTFSLLLASLGTTLYLGLEPGFLIINMSKGVMNFSLLAIPFFIIAGGIMCHGGITTRILDFSNIIVGRFRGGLAQVNVLGSMFFGGVSGSAVADVSTVGSMMIPMMDQKGYDKDYSVAVTVSSACQGIIIPPSHNMILYAFAAGGGVSVGRLFLGGVLPGILLGVFLMFVSYVIAVRRGYPREKGVGFKKALKISADAFLGLFTFLIIMLGITLGIFTATESAAVACIYALVITTCVYRTMTVKILIQICYESLRTLAVVMSLIAAAYVYGMLLSRLRIPALATEGLLSISDNTIMLLLLINVVLVVLGCIMDMAPLILICTPIIYPVVVQTLGMSPIQFGIMLLLNLGIGLCTPPVGSALFVGCAVGKAKIETVSKALLPFYFTMILMLILITFIPQLSTTIPDWLMPEV